MSDTETTPPHNGALAKALLAAQKEMPAVKPDDVNPHFKSKFVTLGHLIAKARPVINKHGVAVAQFPSADANGNPTLVTILMHESGERLQFDAPLFLPKNDPQGQGSAITYMRRYALASALGISDQEDDDGNAGSASSPAETVRALTGSDVPSEKQLVLIDRRARDLGADDETALMLVAYAEKNLTGGREGSASKVIDRLLVKDPGAAEATLVEFVAAAAKWNDTLADAPPDTEGLPS